METGERHHVDGQLPQVGVQLTGESQTGRHARHRRRHEMVQVGVRRGRQFERTETDVVQSLVIDAECFVRVLDQLVHGQGRVVRLDYRVGYLSSEQCVVQVCKSIYKSLRGHIIRPYKTTAYKTALFLMVSHLASRFPSLALSRRYPRHHDEVVRLAMIGNSI